MLELKKNVYFVGSFNPNMRVFDIIMETQYGTSYNAYLVCGEKTALIETVHDRFCEDYFDKIREIVPLESIDYVICNHTEPDHSGSLVELIRLNPDITVIASAAGIKNLNSITNTQFHAQVAKDGDTLDLGADLVLKFIIAPNLHWPDSMFTYLESRKILFSCDVLGSHYCEPRVFDDKISYPEAYESAFRHYFDCIVAPFKPFVLSGLKKIEGLDIDMVCNSHGPVLRTRIAWAIEKYKEWSTPKVNEKKTVAVFYVSAYGYTRKMAEKITEELNHKGISATCYDVIHHDMAYLREKLEESDGFLLGSPTINRDALKPIWDVLSVCDAISNKGKPVAIFGSYGWSGEACGMLAERVNSLKLKLVGEPLKVVFKPTEEDLARCAALADDFASALA